MLRQKCKTKKPISSKRPAGLTAIDHLWLTTPGGLAKAPTFLSINSAQGESKRRLFNSLTRTFDENVNGQPNDYPDEFLVFFTTTFFQKNPIPPFKMSDCAYKFSCSCGSSDVGCTERGLGGWVVEDLQNCYLARKPKAERLYSSSQPKSAIMTDC